MSTTFVMKVTIVSNLIGKLTSRLFTILCVIIIIIIIIIIMYLKHSAMPQCFYIITTYKIYIFTEKFKT